MVKINNYLPFILVLAFLLLLPFQVWDSVVLPAQSGKILFGGWAALALLLCWAFQVLFQKKGPVLSLTYVDAALILYVMFMFVHAFIIKPVDIDELYMVRMLSLVPVYLLVRMMPVRLYKYLFAVLLITGAIQAVWGLFQYRGAVRSYFHSYTASGTFFNPGPYAGYLASVFPLAVAILLLPISANNITAKRTRLMYLVSSFIVFLIVAALIASRSRSAWTAVIVTITYVLLLRYRKALRLRHVMLMAVVAVISVVLFYNIKKDSADGRLFIWNNTFEMIKDRPVTGAGINSFQAQYMHYQAKWFTEHPGSDNDMLADNTIFAFDEPLRITSEQGLPGLLLAILTILAVFGGKQSVKENEYGHIVARAGVLSIVVFGMFSYPLSIFPLQVVLIVYIGITASCQEPFMVVRLTRRKLLTLRTVAVLLAIIAVPFFSLKQYEITTACRELKTAVENYRPDKYERSLMLCRKAWPKLKNNGMFVMIYGSLLAYAGKCESAIPVLERASRLQPATVTYINLGDCYMNMGDFDRAGKSYNYALQMIPSRVMPVYKLAMLYLFKNENDKAMCIIEDYLERKNKKRTIASYEIELELKDIKKELMELCNY